jgi:hypothetical protein
MIKLITTFILLSFQIFTVFGSDIFEKISNKTWFDETGFAGVSIVFMKTESGQIKAIRQINGSGVPVLFTEIYNVEIRQDTIYLLNSVNGQTKENSKNSSYIYNDQQGLSSNGKQLRILFDEPIIYVWTETRKIIDTKVNVNKLTKVSFEENEVFINDEVFKINREN